jgi:signal transduction histidine kinase
LHALRASPLEELGLILAIRDMAELAAEQAGFQLELSLPATMDNVDPDIEQCIYRVAQEALQNVTRHANAQQVKLMLSRRSGTLELLVEDDGDGFEIDASQEGDHFGLRGMLERARLVSGTLIDDSAARQGTRILLRVEAEL